jgi:hypothetical protein
MKICIIVLLLCLLGVHISEIRRDFDKPLESKMDYFFLLLDMFLIIGLAWVIGMVIGW